MRTNKRKKGGRRRGRSCNERGNRRVRETFDCASLLISLIGRSKVLRRMECVLTAQCHICLTIIYHI